MGGEGSRASPWRMDAKLLFNEINLMLLTILRAPFWHDRGPWVLESTMSVSNGNTFPKSTKFSLLWISM